MDNLRPPVGAVKKKNIVGRGPGSGNGKTSGRGMNGQNSRTGGGVRPGFEGGQTPLIRRLPKRGFKNSKFQEDFNIINVYLLDGLKDNTVVTKEMLIEMNLVKYPKKKIKILGNGDFSKKLEVHADAFSLSAKEKIEKAGGKAILK